MGGKSTYLRQAALIVLMAQMGSFVPARSARLGLVDRIFTRIGAADNLARGRSTFMVEMTETAAILNTATPRSLILLDEVGRGTATYDGLAIAWAAIEYIHANTRAKTLFATHYHELTELADRLSGVKNYHVVGERERRRNCLSAQGGGGRGRQELRHRGGQAGRAAVAMWSIARAKCWPSMRTPSAAPSGIWPTMKPATPAAMQLTIFTPLSQKIVDRIKETDLNRLSPLEALNLLHELKKQME